LDKTVWPSGLRRWLQAPLRKDVGASPTAVIRMFADSIASVCVCVYVCVYVCVCVCVCVKRFGFKKKESDKMLPGLGSSSGSKCFAPLHHSG
jgi:hypothetical protein